MLNIEIGGMGVTRALCDRFEHRATEKILARFDFLSEIISVHCLTSRSCRGEETYRNWLKAMQGRIGVEKMRNEQQ